MKKKHAPRHRERARRRPPPTPTSRVRHVKLRLRTAVLAWIEADARYRGERLDQWLANELAAMHEDHELGVHEPPPERINGTGPKRTGQRTTMRQIKLRLRTPILTWIEADAAVHGERLDDWLCQELSAMHEDEAPTAPKPDDTPRPGHQNVSRDERPTGPNARREQPERQPDPGSPIR